MFYVSEIIKANSLLLCHLLTNTSYFFKNVTKNFFTRKTTPIQEVSNYIISTYPKKPMKNI